MKRVQCDRCEVTAEGETFEQWMTALQPHYMEAHAEVMRDRGRTKAEMETERDQWMAQNRARFDAAPEV